MTSESWVPTSLGDEAEIITGFPFKSTGYTDAVDDVRLLRGDNIGQGRLRWEGAKRWSAGDLDQYEEYRLQAEDVVLAMDRPWIEAGLKFASVRESDLPALLVQRVARLRGSDTLDTRYLRYLIGSPQFTRHVLAVQTGTAVPHISAHQIREFRFLRPPPREQQRLAGILGSLDDKIEMNRRMNETLEATARAIFKSWFVDFDPVRAKMKGRQPFGMSAETAAIFPDGFEPSALGPGPKGWTIAELGQLAAAHMESLNPQDYPEEVFNHFSIPAFDAGGSPIAQRGSEIKSAKRVLPNGAILLSRLNPRFPRTWWADWDGGRRAIASTEFLVATPRPGERSFLYCLFQSDDFRTSMNGLVAGTSGSHQRVNQRALLKLRVRVPPRGVLRQFDSVAGPLLERRGISLSESETLATLRDALLPVLLSGEGKAIA